MIQQSSLTHCLHVLCFKHKADFNLCSKESHSHTDRMTEEVCHQDKLVKLELQDADGQLVSRLVPYSSISNVEFYSGMIRLLSPTLTPPYNLPYPISCAGGFDRYTAYLLSKTKYTVEALQQAFNVAHTLGDDDYLQYLISDCLLTDWLLYSPILNQLPQPLQVDIYQRLPYSLVPIKLARQYSFLESWRKANSSRADNYEVKFKLRLKAADTTSLDIIVMCCDSSIVEKHTNKSFVSLDCRWFTDPQLNHLLSYESRDIPYYSTNYTANILYTVNQWDKTGAVDYQRIVNETDETWTKYLSNGNKYYQIFRKRTNNYPNDEGIRTDYYDLPGNPVCSVMSMDRFHYRDGSYEEWSSSGQLTAKGQYDCHKKVGQWTEMRDDVMVVNEYVDGYLMSTTAL